MTPPADPSRIDRFTRTAALWVTLALLGLHLFFFGHAGAFWRDEVNVINLAQEPSWAGLSHDSFPILLPLLIKAWSWLGLAGTDLSLRVLGLLVGGLLVAALWLAALAGARRPPLLSLTLLGLNSGVIFWGDSLRAFGLGSALMLLTAAALCGLLAKPTWARAAVLSLTAILAVQALYQNTVFFAALAAGGWLVCWRRRDRAAAGMIAAAALAAALSIVPYAAAVTRWQQATTIRPGFSAKAAAGNLQTLLAFPLPFYGWVWLLLGILVLGLGLFSLVQRAAPVKPAGPDRIMSGAEQRLFAGGVLLVSLAGYLCFLKVAAMITSPWYFLPLAAMAAVCFDFSFPLSAPGGMVRTIVGAGMLGTVILSIVFAVRDLNCRLTNMDLTARYLQRRLDPGDYVLVTPWYLGISFERYYRGAAAWDTLPPVADHSTHRFDLVPGSAAAEARAREPVLARMTQALRAGHRVWIVGWMRVPPPGRASASAEGGFLAAHSRQFEPVDLAISGHTSDFEEVSLLRAEGWRDEPAK